MLRCSRQVSTIDDKFTMSCATEKSISHTKLSKYRERIKKYKNNQTWVMKKHIILTHLPVLVYTLKLIRAAKEYSPSKCKLLDKW
jgi:SPX domain protein involved in polyphosphate accumulation